jgi:hypothetical protein
MFSNGFLGVWKRLFWFRQLLSRFANSTKASKHLHLTGFLRNKKKAIVSDLPC